MWKNMSTAPRDGTQILILTSDGAYAMEYIPGEWNDNYYEGSYKDPDTWCAVDLSGMIPDDLIIETETFDHPEIEGAVVIEDNQALAWMPMPTNTKEMRAKHVDHVHQATD